MILFFFMHFLETFLQEFWRNCDICLSWYCDFLLRCWVSRNANDVIYLLIYCLCYDRWLDLYVVHVLCTFLQWYNVWLHVADQCLMDI